MRATGQAWQVLILFLLGFGGVCLGLLAPTEAAAIGARRRRS
ncbi:MULTISPECIES: hypothetical protein [Rhizobium/Agrobacterium group]|jgi:C4-dicarboxylate transporter DctM subunit|uniref:Uncharacterized protein n=2 Tax=Neorhizobium TaxID=1525371 RepID=A0ABV0M361_9HYPH|nr:MULTISPECIES: hypothetical protein [Rhizobium/Agrobacterium group]WGI69663.1 hypothetical protein QEO92_06230 [Neorhizobium petrolearium]